MIISMRGERRPGTSNTHKPKREEGRRGGGAEKRRVRATVPPKAPETWGQLGRGRAGGRWAPPPGEVAVVASVVMTVRVAIPVTESRDDRLLRAAFHAPAAAEDGTMDMAGSAVSPGS